MRNSVLSTIIAAGLLAGSTGMVFGDDNDKDDRKEHKQWHKEQSKEHKNFHKEDRDDDRLDREYPWYRGDRPHHDDGRGQSHWERNRRGDHPRHESRGQYDWQKEDRSRYYNREHRDRDFDHRDRDSWNRHERERRDGDRFGNRGERSVGFTQPLANTSKIGFNQLPPAVRRTVQQQAQGAPIEDVERGTLNGRTVYEVAFKKNGVHNELRVLEDGNVLRQIAGDEIRFPGSMRLSEVPRPVQDTIRQRVGSAEINDIDRRNVNGRVVYEVGFKRGDGVQRELQISENGSVIREAAGAETHR